MDPRSFVGRALAVTLLAVAVVVIVGALLGQPLLLGLVESGSMEPSISTGDGVVTIPAAIAGPVEPGDVVVYDPERLNDGGLIVHRVVGETERGFLTKGTANTFTDQSFGEPPVQADQIVAVVPQVAGGPVVIPHLGDVVARFGVAAIVGVQGLALVIAANYVLGPAREIWRERSGRGTEREDVGGQTGGTADRRAAQSNDGSAAGGDPAGSGEG